MDKTSTIVVICILAVFTCVTFCLASYLAGVDTGKDAAYKEAVKAGAAVHVVDADGCWTIRWVVK